MTRARRGPGPFGVVSAAVGLFFVVLALLAFQMRAQETRSHAPAIGTPAARRVLLRRVVIRKVVIHVRGEGDDGATRAVQVAIPVPAPAAAPAPAAPAPAPVQAPQAPPLVTRTS